MLDIMGLNRATATKAVECVLVGIYHMFPPAAESFSPVPLNQHPECFPTEEGLGALELE